MKCINNMNLRIQPVAITQAAAGVWNVFNPLGSEGKFRKTGDSAMLCHLWHFNELYIQLSQSVS